MKKKSKTKKIKFIILFLITLIIFITIFIKNHYKFSENGNNINSKQSEEIVNDILNISSYKAEIEMTVTGNKNTSKYKMTQAYTKPNICTQEIIEPSNIAGLKIMYNENTLYINNTNLNLETIYKDYPYIAENIIWLSDFINIYSNDNNKEIVEEKEEIVLKCKKEGNKYNVYYELNIDKKTGKPTKLLIRDVNKKEVVYIVYTKVEMSS